MKKKTFSRRNFIRSSALGVVGGSLMSNTVFAEDEKVSGGDFKQNEPAVKEYRTLGRTGFKVSDIGLGSSNNKQVMVRALESGVNYIDTAESYNNQTVVGAAINGFKRDKIFITSKLEIGKETDEKKFIQRFEKCLKELETDYIDCMMAHCPDTVEMMKTPGFHSAMEKMKKEGKLRFTGVSHHGTNWFRAPEVSMTTMLNAAIDDGRFDVFLMAYNFIQEDLGSEVIKRCAEKNIGVSLMKINPVGKYYIIRDRIAKLEAEGKEVHPLFREGIVRFKDKADKAEGFIKKYGLNDPRELDRGAVKFVLDNPNVGTAVCSMKNFDDVDHFLSLSGTRLTEKETEKLSCYKEGPGALYCRHGCSSCLPACPNGIPINDIFRYNHYFDAHNREKYAIAKYSSLEGRDAALCVECEGHCEKACPYGLPVQGMLSMVHQNLTLC